MARSRFAGAFARMVAQQQPAVSTAVAVGLQAQTRAHMSAWRSVSCPNMGRWRQEPPRASPAQAPEHESHVLPSSGHVWKRAPIFRRACWQARRVRCGGHANVGDTCFNAQQRLALEARAPEPQHCGEAAELQVRRVRRVEEGRVQQRLQVGPLPCLLQDLAALSSCPLGGARRLL